MAQYASAHRWAHAKVLDLRRELFHEQCRGTHLYQRGTASGEEFDDIL